MFAAARCVTSVFQGTGSEMSQRQWHRLGEIPMQKLLIVKWLGGKIYGLSEIKLLQECSGWSFRNWWSLLVWLDRSVCGLLTGFLGQFCLCMVTLLVLAYAGIIALPHWLNVCSQFRLHQFDIISWVCTWFQAVSSNLVLLFITGHFFFLVLFICCLCASTLIGMSFVWVGNFLLCFC